MIHLHVHRGNAAPRPAGRASVAPFEVTARRAVDHDAIPLGLFRVLKEKLGARAAGEVERVMGNFPSPPRRIDRNHHVRTLAVSSRNGEVTYIDCRTPDFIYVGKLGGGVAAMVPDRPLNEHEEVEWVLMYGGGWLYPDAHEVANIAEELVVRDMGFDPKSYQTVMNDLVKFAESAPVLSPPPDPHVEECDCDRCRGGLSCHST